jgi:hypothetical protein
MSNLSYHWLDSAGNTLVWDGLRTSLAGMKVGEVRIVQMNVTTPTAVGSYILRPDIAREGVTWFSGRGMMLPVAHDHPRGRRSTARRTRAAELRRGAEHDHDRSR